jgi:DUF4097 and DUF4098 domain-containing protein YvlB
MKSKSQITNRKSQIAIQFTVLVLCASGLLLYAETEEQLNKRFTVEPGGKLVVNVDFGAIDVKTNGSNEVVVDVYRKVTRKKKADEEAFLRERPVTFSQDGNHITIESKHHNHGNVWSSGSQRTEGKYTITVPPKFSAQLTTAGGSIALMDLAGDTTATTSGGNLEFDRLHGPVDGNTSGGAIHLVDCDGKLKVRTSGGAIEVLTGSGSLDGNTSGGPVTVRNFHGPAHVETSGGPITIENVTGKLNGSTSGGHISARFSEPPSDEVKLETSGGGVTVDVPGNSSFDLDAETSGGGVHSDLPVAVVGKAEKDHLKGPVNGGGKPIILRTSGGTIRVRKS